MNGIIKSTFKMAGGSGCGCTGGAKPICSCNDPGCEICKSQEICRPRFFSGQLLTEDDMQSLVYYVKHKNNLHNKYLHGAGVVCGLEVHCNPCGGGKVIVRPGYAIDCCGNDINISCEVPLDVNAMVRDLKLSNSGGYDCGDPCSDPSESNSEKPKLRKYCLYVSYCETMADPVTPYVTEEPCGPPICEPTRVCEGFRFELRCPEEDPVPIGIWDRIQACIGDIVETEEMARKAYVAATSLNSIKVANKRFAEKLAAPELDDEDSNILKDEPTILASIMKNLKDDAKKDDGDFNEILIRNALNSIVAISASLARYKLSKPNKIKITRKTIDDAMVGIDSAINYFNENKLADKLPQGFDRETGRAILMDSQDFHKKATDNNVTDQDQGIYLLSHGVTTNSSIFSLFNKDAAKLREWLLSRLDKKPYVNDCKLKKDIENIQVNGGSGDKLMKIESDQMAKLLKALIRYLIDCICSALNPPCVPCEESAVKLACLELDECEVVRVCAMERSFVLSSTAVYYWLPQLHSIGEALENLCCNIYDLIGRAKDDRRELFSTNLKASKESHKKAGEGYVNYFSRIGGLKEDRIKGVFDRIWNLGKSFTSESPDIQSSVVGSEKTEKVYSERSLTPEPQVSEALRAEINELNKQMIKMKEELNNLANKEEGGELQ